MNFDFDNYNEYLVVTVTDEARRQLARLDACINGVPLNAKERSFIDSIRERILGSRKISEKQARWLATIIEKCNQHRARAIIAPPKKQGVMDSLFGL